MLSSGNKKERTDEVMKRVYCLYRVSTKGQVDKDDIPMQKKLRAEHLQKETAGISSKNFRKKVCRDLRYRQVTGTLFRI